MRSSGEKKADLSTSPIALRAMASVEMMQDAV
jgi:hypothetical protein